MKATLLRKAYLQGLIQIQHFSITKIEGRAIPGISFSQPDNAHALLLTTQFLASQDYAQSIRTVRYSTLPVNTLIYFQNVLQKMVRRMTRFFVTLPVSEAVKAVKAAGTQLGYTFRQLSSQQVR